MNKIRVLPDNLANQIAAGEVVERPASVIKELVENSIDAGAERIRIEIELGGRRLMKMSDDGEGMTRDDAILAFERHATSKIRRLDDLIRIETLGFRGEALASIASVAKIELATKSEDDLAATLVQIEGGRLIDVRDAARPTGTTVAVRDLFFNTPARRKFMRSEATENYHIASITQHYALAHPEIAFVLMNNGREVINVSPAKDLRERAFQIFGGGLLDSLLPVEGGRDTVARVSGFISAPRERRTNRDSQYFFVNRRFVRDRVIAEGLGEGYRSVLPQGVFPVAFLFIEVPPDEIDVNVHPAKTEIRFRRSEAVKDVLAEAVRRSLANAGIVSEKLQPASETEAAARSAAASSINTSMNSAQGSISFDPGTIEGAETLTGGSIRNTKPSVHPDHVRIEALDENKIVDRFGNIAEELSGEGRIDAVSDNLDQLGFSMAAFAANASRPVGNPELPPVGSARRFAKSVEADRLSGAKIRPIGQLHDSFIIAADDEGLLLIDQHVAHERVLFDKFRAGESGRNIESQNLLLPETIDLTPSQSEVFRLIEDELAGLGFDLMRLSGRTIAIKSIPTDVPPSEVRNLFAEILDGVDVHKRGSAKALLRDDIAASLACKAAIKINMKLTTEKMEWLIDRLMITSSPTTCPHGRPVILRLSIKDIERGFHRT